MSSSEASTSSLSTATTSGKTVFEQNAIVIPSASTASTLSENDDETGTVGTEADANGGGPGSSGTTSPQEVTFQSHFDNLMRFCTEILKYKMNSELQLESVTNSNIIKTCLNKYYDIYRQSRDRPSHVFAVQAVWTLCQKHLKRNRENRSVDIEGFATWLHNSSLSIKPPVENARAKVMITSIYINAKRISDSIFAKAEFAENTGDHKAASELYKNPALNYSNKFILLLLRLFQYSVSKDNKIVFTPIDLVTEAISKLEEELGLKANEEPEYGSGLGDILGIIQDLTKTVGIKLPSIPGMTDGADVFTGKNINRAMGELKSNPKMQSDMKSMFDGLNIDMNNLNANSLPQAFTNLMQTMQKTAQQEPEFIARSRNATVENPTGASSSTGTDLVPVTKKTEN